MSTKLPAGRGQRILVMDDELEIRNLADRMLRHLGYRPITVANGEEAIRAYEVALEEGNPVTGVILDLTIKGGMGGLETLRRLRERNRQLPIIVSSGYSEDKAFVAHQEFGFNAAIPKPYEIATFASVVHKVLHDQAAPEPPEPSSLLAD